MSSTDPFRDRLMLERFLELNNEGVRCLDLKRWGMFDSQTNLNELAQRSLSFNYFEVGKYHRLSILQSEDENNPILQNPDSLVGTGHSAFFKDKQDKLYIVYHAYNSTDNVHPRKAYFNPVLFKEVVGENRFTLKVQQHRTEVKATPSETK